MKKLILPIIATMIVAISSCKDDVDYTPFENTMKDSIFAAYPTSVGSVRLHATDKTDLRIVLGGQKLYATPPQDRQKMADDLGKMAIRIFGKDSYLRTGVLVLTKNEQNTEDSPADGISTKIDIEALKK